MENQGQHGKATVVAVDLDGNPVAGHGVDTTDVAGRGPGAGGAPPAGTGGQFQPAAETKSRGILHRSGSSSSSSSSDEDDGMGGRRKKGMKEKIKEKLPGGKKDNQNQAAYGGTGHTGTTGAGTGVGTGGVYAPTTEGTHQKKGVMEKVKETLPGGHKDSAQQHGTAGTTTTTTGGYAPGHTGTTGTYGTTEGTHEKKGVMEKIKEKLPGQH